MPELMRQLPLLATQWTQPCTDVGAQERLYEDVFSGLRRSALRCTLGPSS